MAGRPIVIQFAANVRDFLAGTRDVERATEDIADELKDATRDAERFEREFQDSMRDAERAADKSARNIGRDFDRAGDEIGEVGRESGEEFQSNLSEALSSGDLSSIAQDTAAGLVGAFKGPVGWAAAAMAGTVALAVQDITERAQVWKDTLEAIIADLRAEQDAITGDMSAFQRLQAFNDLLKDNPEWVERTAQYAALAGVEFEEAAYAIRFGGDEAEALTEELNRQIEAAGAHRDEQGAITGEIDGSVIAADKLLRMIEDGAQAMGEEAAHADRVGDAIDYASDRLADTYDPMLATIEERWKRIRSAVDDLSKQRRTVWIEFRASGNAASYVTRGEANYSPAYVAIDNIYRNP